MSIQMFFSMELLGTAGEGALDAFVRMLRSRCFGDEVHCPAAKSGSLAFGFSAHGQQELTTLGRDDQGYSSWQRIFFEIGHRKRQDPLAEERARNINVGRGD